MSRPEKDLIASALSFDALSCAETLTGHSYKDDKGTELLGLALHMSHVRMKKEALRNSRDTYFSMPMSEWIAVIESIGFELVLTIPIPGTVDLYRMWWMPGVLLCADTYGGIDTMNGATAYFDYHGPRNALDRCSSSHGGTVDGQDFWHASLDAREGFRHHVERMLSEGRFLSEWAGQPFICLLHYMDTKNVGYDHKKITAERIAMLPSHIRAAIERAA